MNKIERLLKQSKVQYKNGDVYYLQPEEMKRLIELVEDEQVHNYKVTQLTTNSLKRVSEQIDWKEL